MLRAGRVTKKATPLLGQEISLGVGSGTTLPLLTMTNTQGVHEPPVQMRGGCTVLISWQLRRMHP